MADHMVSDSPAAPEERCILRIRIAPGLQWDYPLTEFDLLVQPGLTMHGVMQVLGFRGNVSLRVNGTSVPPGRLAEDEDLVEIDDARTLTR